MGRGYRDSTQINSTKKYNIFSYYSLESLNAANGNGYFPCNSKVVFSKSYLRKSCSLIGLSSLINSFLLTLPYHSFSLYRYYNAINLSCQYLL